MWTKFYDMASGGWEKNSASVIWIEAPLEVAVDLFELILGHDPRNITCACCGVDYLISEQETLTAGSDDFIVKAADIARVRLGNVPALVKPRRTI